MPLWKKLQLKRDRHDHHSSFIIHLLRLKYLRSVHTELGNITDVTNRLALAHPEVAIRLIHNGRKLLQRTDGDVRQVLAAIYGMNIARKNTIQSNSESLDFTI